MFIAKGVKSSLQRELDSFYKEVKGADFNIRHVTKGAFSQARAKLKPEAFVEMNENINETFYSEAPYLIWRGLRLVGGDGSTLNLPQSENITKEFRQDGYGPNADHQKTLAIISILYDVLNLVVIDAQISSRATGERELLVNQLKKLKQDDLLLLDRGYPGLGLFFLLAARGIPFCMRMMVDGWDKVIAFEKSGEKEKIVRFTLPKTQRFYLEDFPEWIDREIECRLVRIELKNGETEILCTSLLDFKQYPHPEFKELYHTRWGVEEGFKLLN